MPASMQAVVGLGNPGDRYADTRHNAGFWFLDRLSRELGCEFSQDRKLNGAIASIGVGDDKRFLFKPGSYMNNSGGPVGAFLNYYRIPPTRVVVAYDELDLPPGTVRLKRGGGHGGHNGLRDLYAHLPDTDFVRLRIGIGHPGHKERVVGHVLSRPGREEEDAILEGITRALEVMPLVLEGELEKAMSRLHSE